MPDKATVPSATIPAARVIDLWLRPLLASEAERNFELATASVAQLKKEGARLTPSQLEGFVAVALAAENAVEVQKFIERQAARQKDWEKAAPALLKVLQDLRNSARAVAAELHQQVTGTHPEFAGDPEVVSLKDEKAPRVRSICCTLVADFVGSFGIHYRFENRGATGREEE